jgi:hypothetical protein
MLLIFGTTLRDRVLVVVDFVCGFCGVASSQEIIERATRISLFFIPLVTIGRRHVVVCTHCGADTPLSRQQAENGLAWARRNRQVG